MDEETLRWILGFVLLGMGGLAGWFIAHGKECKQWRERVMERIGRLEGKRR